MSLFELQREIARDWRDRLQFRPLLPDALPLFTEKIVSVAGYLPDPTLSLLCEAVQGEFHRDRVHLPVHKRGATVSYHQLHYDAPEIIAFYLSPELHDWCSSIAGERVVPTPIHDLSSCSILIYERPNDHIRCHYDRNFYRGRHFTALLSLINTNAAGNGVSSARLVVRRNSNETTVPTPPNTLVFFEGAHIYHGVTPLKEGERRLMLSMTFCTDPAATAVQDMTRRFKDIAYFGFRALWT